MSFAEGLLLAYLKVGVLAAAILAVIWAISKGFLALYNWQDKATGEATRSGDAAGSGHSADDKQ